MSNKILYWKKQGGAIIVLLLFALSGGLAQTPPNLVNCGQLSVEFVPVEYTGTNHGSSCSYCCGAGTISCQRIMYNVYLRAENITGGLTLPSNGNFDLAYTELYITLRLSRGTSAMASYINAAQTESCLASYLSTIPDGSYETKTEEDEVTLHISSDAGDATPVIPFLNFESNGPLFAVVVDAFPGESIGIECVLFSYSSAEDDCSGDCPGVTNESFPAPSGTNVNLSVTLGAINCDPEEYIDLPILMTSSIGNSIGFIDFAVVVNSTAPDGFFAAPEFIDILSGTSPVVTVIYNQATSQYVVHFRYSAPSWSVLFGTDQELGVLRIYRPMLLCQEYTVSASLTAGRVITGSDCRSFGTGTTTSAFCEMDGLDECAEFDLSILVDDSPPNCTTLVVRATLGWDEQISVLDFNQFRAILEIQMDNGVSITDVELEGFECPSSGNDPVGCAGGCVQYGGNRVEICINVVNPIEVDNGASVKVTFSAPVGCIPKVTVRKMLLRLPNESACQPTINDPDPGDFPYCSPAMENFIQGDIATEQGCWAVEVDLEVIAASGSGCNRFMLVGGSSGDECGPYTTGCICDIETADAYTLTPERDDNPLNGVTTYDLVLISQHILGTAPFDSPYKMIAADANRSGSITTFDIVEFRKLILGIYTELPVNTSWRFVPESFTFPNANNPFGSAFPEAITVTSLPEQSADFVAIKVGDVNGTADPGCAGCDAFERPNGEYALTEPRRGASRPGDILTVPVRAGGAEPLIALQAALRFDPELLELIGPSMGDVPGLTEHNFNLAGAADGIVRASWNAQLDALEEEALMPGQSLFNLVFRARQDMPEGMPLLSVDGAIMPNLGWTGAGTAYSIQTAVSASRERDIEGQAAPASVRCRPNPGSGELVFDIAGVPPHKRARLSVFDAFGRRVWHQDLGGVPFPHQLRVPEAASWPAGVFNWELRHDGQRLSGSFVRQ